MSKWFGTTLRAAAVALFLVGLWATATFARLYWEAVTGAATGQWQFAALYTPGPALVSLLCLAIWRIAGPLPRVVLVLGAAGAVVPLLIGLLMLAS
jgi:hypothetical protein